MQTEPKHIGRAHPMDTAEQERRTAAVQQWLKDREIVGNAPAARALRYCPEVLRNHALKLGIRIPKLTHNAYRRLAKH